MAAAAHETRRAQVSDTATSDTSTLLAPPPAIKKETAGVSVHACVYRGSGGGGNGGEKGHGYCVHWPVSRSDLRARHCQVQQIHSNSAWVLHRASNTRARLTMPPWRRSAHTNVHRVLGVVLPVFHSCPGGTRAQRRLCLSKKHTTKAQSQGEQQVQRYRCRGTGRSGASKPKCVGMQRHSTTIMWGMRIEGTDCGYMRLVLGQPIDLLPWASDRVARRHTSWRTPLECTPGNEGG